MRHALFSAAGILCLATAALAQTSTSPPAEQAGQQRDVGFRLEVQGAPRDMDPQAFASAVLSALPQPLTDPEQNFTRHELYEAGADYRMVVVFYGNDSLEAQGLCAATAGDRAPDAEPPAFEKLTTTTRVAAAFCKGEETLSSATDQMTGELKPDQASFRFLVADVTKQLFPGGFDVMPGSGTTTATTQP